MTAWRDSYLNATRDSSLESLRRDYRLVRAGDLAALAFCNNWPEVAAGECGYGMRVDGTTLVVTPDPSGGRSLEIDIEAREIPALRFASAAAARHALQAAPITTIEGVVKGSA